MSFINLIFVGFLGDNMKTCNPGEEFYFKMPNEQIIGKAANIKEFIDLIHTLPAESLYYHQTNKHFSPWISHIGEKTKAKKISLMKAVTTENIRMKLLKILL